MGFDGVAEFDLTLAHAQARLAGGRILDDVPDDEAIPKDPQGNIRPYAILFFGAPFPSPRDRSIGPETQQPQVQPIRFECYGATRSDARELAGGVKRTFLDWQPNENATPYAFSGGGSFRARDTAGALTRYMEVVNFETVLNMVVTL